MMNQDDPTNETGFDLNRRYFIGAAGGIGASLLAGCSSNIESPSTTDSSDGTNGSDGSKDPNDGDDTGTFRLLISDKPVAIDDFDSLNVAFDSARIFNANVEGDESEEDETDGTDTEGEEDGIDEEEPEESSEETVQNDEDAENDEDTPEDGTQEQEQEEDATEADDTADGQADDGEGDFYTIDLEHATVDLTKVVGDKAVGVFEGGLAAGTYSKIELHVSDVEGIVDGGLVEVKVPSQKLQITKPFEVTAGESLSFVFDINVVEKGQGGEYNLLPVISKSGVAGTDVDVEEIDDDEGDDESEDDEEGRGEDQEESSPEDDADSDGEQGNGTAE